MEKNIPHRGFANELMMVRPVHFGANPETAASNAFQSGMPEDTDHRLICEKAIHEFDQMVSRLRNEGVVVHVVEDMPDIVRPDAVFPNNWVTFHEDGIIYVYPMMAPSRQAEIREDVLDIAVRMWGFQKVIRFDKEGRGGEYLEGTGSMILDRENRITYACISPRTTPALLSRWAELAGYFPVLFNAVDEQGKEIYHTNVMMALGNRYTVICLEAIRNEVEKNAVVESFKNTGKSIIEITFDQMNHFAGNMLEIRNSNGDALLVMSEQAYQSLTKTQTEMLQQFVKLIPIPLWTIEKYGGGSARCMMAEVFSPVKS